MKKTITTMQRKDQSSHFQSSAFWQKRIKEYLDPPDLLNPTVGLFIGGYAIAFLAIWQWYKGIWPLPILVGLAFLALHMEGTVIHDACHKAAHPNKWVNAALWHAS